MTGLVAPIGVAAGVGKLMGLTEQQLMWAMGIGAMQGSGFRSSHGTMSTAFIPGDAGRNGLLAAHLASQNFTCQDEPLTSPNGLLPVVGRPANADALINGLGQHWECMNAAIKPFPNGCLVHATTDVCLELVRSHAFDSREIQSVSLQVHPLGLTLTGMKEPKDSYQAQASVYHWAAAVLHHGRAGLYEASGTCVHDPKVIALRQRVVATVADDLQADEARATVTLRDGRVLQAEVRPHMGSARRPLTDDQLDTKFLAQVEPRWGAPRARELADICWNLAQASDVGQAAPGCWGHGAATSGKEA
jgi:2-methylcitrate dehydratase PrpD